MENRRVVKICCLVLFLAPLSVSAFDNDVTHPMISKVGVLIASSTLSLTDVADIERGSKEEDIAPRWIHHFNDPLYERGLTLGLRKFMQASVWANSPVNDLSWDKSVYEYVWGDRTKGLEGLGHALHLLQDSAVPEHTRNDEHAFGSVFEKYAMDKTVVVPDSAATCFSISECFRSLSYFSNTNFFSADTIFAKQYRLPDNFETNVENLEIFAVSRLFATNESYRLFKIERRAGTRKNKFTLDDIDNKIYSDYWRLLSRQAVAHTAALTKLFFIQAEEERTTGALKSKFYPKSGFQKFLDGENFWSLDATNEPAVSTLISVYGSASLGDALKPVSVVPPVALGGPHTSEPPTPMEPIETPFLGKDSLQATSSDSEAPGPSQVPIMPGFGGGMVLRIAQNSFQNNNEMSASAGQGSSETDPSPTMLVEETSVNPPTPPVPPPDTIPPDIWLDIAACSSTISPDSCVLLAATSTIATWNSRATDLAEFEITDADGTRVTTATSTILIVGENLSRTVSVRARDTNGNWSEILSKTVEVKSVPLIINELFPSPSSQIDHYVELYNPTEVSISLNTAVLHSTKFAMPYAHLSGVVAPRGYFVVAASSTVRGVRANLEIPFDFMCCTQSDQIAVSFVEGGATTTVDTTAEPRASSQFWTGLTSDTKSLERFRPTSLSREWSSWRSADCEIERVPGSAVCGTPGKMNSVSHYLEPSSIVSETTVTKEWSPYFLRGSPTIQTTGRLVVEPGVVFKMRSDGGMLVKGALDVRGTSAEPVVFTAVTDDAHGGDLDGDGGVYTPSGLSWGSIRLSDVVATLQLDHAIVRFGGRQTFVDAPIEVDQAVTSMTIRDSVIDGGGGYGVYATKLSGGGIFERNEFKNVTNGTALYVVNMATSTIKDNIFRNNKIGVFVTATALTMSGNIAENNITPVSISQLYNESDVRNNTGSNNNENAFLFSSALTMTHRGTTTYGYNPGLPYYLTTQRDVVRDSTARFVDGAVIKFSTRMQPLNIYGRLELVGTPEHPVLVTSAADDSDGSDLRGDGPQTPEVLYSTGFRTFAGSATKIEHAIFRWLWYGVWYRDGSPIDLSYVTFENNNMGVQASTPAVVSHIDYLTFQNNATDATPADLFASSTPE